VLHQKPGRRLRLDTARRRGYEMHMANDGWVRVVGTGEIAPGEGRVVEAAGRTLAVFNVDGTYYAIDNTCSHRGGPLGDGDLDGTVVTCPWHAWRWDVTSGANVNNPAVRVACFPARVQDGAVFVHVAN
jgi:nitrite reductase (NADH) small subunit